MNNLENQFDEPFEEEEFEEELEENSAEPESKTKDKPISLPHIIDLEFPVEWGKDEIRKIITIKRRLQTKDVMSIPTENLKFGHMVTLVSKITGEPLSFVKELDTIDLFKCIRVLQNFLPVSQETGDHR